MRRRGNVLKVYPQVFVQAINWRSIRGTQDPQRLTDQGAKKPRRHTTTWQVKDGFLVS